MDDSKMELYNQAQQATTTIHPGKDIGFLPVTSISSAVSEPVNAILRNGMVNATPPRHIDVEKLEKFNKIRARKDKKQERRATKNVKGNFVTEEKDEYNIDNVLEELGEQSNSSKKSSGNKPRKVTNKGETRKRNKGNKKETSSTQKNKESSQNSTATSTEDEDEEDEELDQDVKEDQESSSHHLEADSLFAHPSSMLNRQTSRSTEDMFTPVIKKHNKWKNKKSFAKDDSGHCYSSTSSNSSASSTTSSCAVVNNGSLNHSSSTLSAKQKSYNLRRKSALRPSQSFDLKSATSSVASDDTLEAAGSAGLINDQLDLSADFPPLSSNETSTVVAAAANSDKIQDSVDQFVPKWVTKTISQQQHSDLANSSSSSSCTSSAVIDASDQVSALGQNSSVHSQPPNSKNTEVASHPASPSMLLQNSKPPPPPDVTVVPQMSNASQQCTARAGLLPDIAAQAPHVLNNTNSSSSGVSSNAGDLTPPQTLLMSEPLSFYEDSGLLQDDPKDSSSSSAVVILGDDTASCDPDCQTIEFGFEVNVLDLISGGQLERQVDHDDEAIVSFGSTIQTVLNSPESGIGSGSDPDHDHNDSYNTSADAVKIPNYAQIVSYVAKSWKKVEQELKKGAAQKY